MDQKKLRKIITVICIVTVSVFVLALTAACVIDKRHTVVELRGENTVTVPYKGTYTERGATAYSDGQVFGCIKNDLPVTTVGDVDTDKLGEYEITYSASFLWMNGSAVRTVCVVDSAAPVITLTGDVTAEASWFNGYTEEGFSAIDDFDGDITDKVERTELVDRIIYTVSDSAGNVATAERLLDYSAGIPILTLSGSEELSVKASTDYQDPGCTAADSLGNDLTEFIVKTGDVIPYQPGTYEIVYSVSNDMGDTVSATRTVNVIGSTLPDTVYPTTKTIYLTFDDGPGPYTSQLLDVLARYGVKATFFVTNLYGYSDMIGREFREGHTVAVHTKCHDYYTIYASEDAYIEDFNAMQSIIYQQTGTYACLFRFPGGSSNTVSRFNEGVMSRLTVDMEALGYKYFDWNVDSDDAGHTRSTDGVFENVIAGVEGKTYSVVLQHDIKDYSVDAVERIILWGLENGYRFEALSATSPDAHHGLNN